MDKNKINKALNKAAEEAKSQIMPWDIVTPKLVPIIPFGPGMDDTTNPTEFNPVPWPQSYPWPGGSDAPASPGLGGWYWNEGNPGVWIYDPDHDGEGWPIWPPYGPQENGDTILPWGGEEGSEPPEGWDEMDPSTWTPPLPAGLRPGWVWPEWIWDEKFPHGGYWFDESWDDYNGDGIPDYYDHPPDPVDPIYPDGEYEIPDWATPREDFDPMELEGFDPESWRMMNVSAEYTEGQPGGGPLPWWNPLRWWRGRPGGRFLNPGQNPPLPKEYFRSPWEKKHFKGDDPRYRPGATSPIIRTVYEYGKKCRKKVIGPHSPPPHPNFQDPPFGWCQMCRKTVGGGQMPGRQGEWISDPRFWDNGDKPYPNARPRYQPYGPGGLAPMGKDNIKKYIDEYKECLRAVPPNRPGKTPVRPEVLPDPPPNGPRGTGNSGPDGPGGGSAPPGGGGDGPPPGGGGDGPPPGGGGPEVGSRASGSRLDTALGNK